LIKKVRLIVNGRVQGVNFRANVKSYCDNFKLGGFVKNCEDGSVEIAAYGTEEELKKLITWLKRSPGLSKVRKIKEIWKENGKTFKNFEIRRDRDFISEQARNFRNLGREIFRKV